MCDSTKSLPIREVSFISQLAGNPWSAPNRWNTMHPQLNLNLDEEVDGYTLHGGAMHVNTEVIEPK